ncbi:MAG: hypothetical protein II936_06355 [Oscillospiraceae bacterium]|nr:hypothetical protein [Oscillospiraceae bacterium]
MPKPNLGRKAKMETQLKTFNFIESVYYTRPYDDPLRGEVKNARDESSAFQNDFYGLSDEDEVEWIESIPNSV